MNKIIQLYYIILQRLYVFIKTTQNKTNINTTKVLMIHKISDDDDIYSIGENDFRKLINAIYQKSKFSSIYDDDFDDNYIITFDDAYDSIYTIARPILNNYNIPYCVFVCNEFIGKEGYLSKEMIEVMSGDLNCTIGSHLYKHILSRFTENTELGKYMMASKEELENITKKEVNTFAFPFGSFFAVSKENLIAAKNIFKYVFMTIPVDYKKEDEFVPRYNINNNSFKRFI